MILLRTPLTMQKKRKELTLSIIVEKMLSDREKWNAMADFANKVITLKKKRKEKEKELGRKKIGWILWAYH